MADHATGEPLSCSDDLEFHRQMLELSMDGIVAHTMEGDLLYANKAAERQWGATVEELRAKGRWSWLPDGMNEHNEALIETVRKEGFARFEALRVRPDGQEMYREVQAQLVDTSHGRICISFMRDVTDRVLAERAVRHMAYHDAGTGLPNRALLMQEIEVAVDAAAHLGVGLSVIFFDVDNFKSINDTYGHTVGDEVLREIAARLSELVRSHDTVARVGGDEFVVVLSGPQSDEASCSVCRRLLEVVAQPIIIGDTKVYVAMSAGIADYVEGDTADSLMIRADLSMYETRQGRGDSRLLA